MSISININFAGTNSFVPSAPSQRQNLAYLTNPSFARYATLTNDSMTFNFFTASVVIPISQLWAAAISASSQLTYPPFILNQPTSSTVTHPTGSTFTISASAEIPFTYQWYWQSSSLSTFIPTPSPQFLGTSSNALTITNTTQSVQNNSQYLCVLTNSAGSTTSSIASLTVL